MSFGQVSWADFCAGLVLDALDRFHVAQDTAVIVHSDHGWVRLSSCSLLRSRPSADNSQQHIRHVSFIAASRRVQHVGKGKRRFLYSEANGLVCLSELLIVALMALGL